MALAAEQQAVALMVGNFGVTHLRFGGERENPLKIAAALGPVFLELRIRGVPVDFDRVPVIKPRAASRTIVAAQSRAMFPVLGGISGSHSATCNIDRPPGSILPIEPVMRFTRPAICFFSANLSRAACSR
jgi:hypothetical protein